jgi:hypothetical protein
MGLPLLRAETAAAVNRGGEGGVEGRQLLLVGSFLGQSLQGAHANRAFVGKVKSIPSVGDILEAFIVVAVAAPLIG